MEGQFYWALGGLNFSPSSEELDQMGLEFPTFFFLGGGGGGGGGGLRIKFFKVCLLPS